MNKIAKPGPVPARGKHKSAYEIEKGLKQSLESADNGLKRFLLSLKESGMTEGTQGYRALGMVLVQQRLWAQSHGRTQLAPLFRSIAKTAGELHQIFAVYAEVMKALKELDKISGVSAAAAPQAPVEALAARPAAPPPAEPQAAAPEAAPPAAEAGEAAEPSE